MRRTRWIPFALAVGSLCLIASLVQDAHAVASRLSLAPIGENPGDMFGKSVSGGGDVNGDGFDDFVVGGPFNSVGGVLAGRAYVFFGGPDADEVPDVTLTGEADIDQFGTSVAIVGDVNGDGFDDVIAGAPFNGAGGSEAGRAYVYYGGPAMDSVADLVFTGSASDRLGEAVSGAGDFNNDGYADVLVGAPPGISMGDPPGSANIYLGGPAPDELADFTFLGEVEADNFGTSVSEAGDINADGYADVIVGAANYDSSGANRGRAYIFYGIEHPGGGIVFALPPDLILTGESGGSFFGSSVSEAGDVNGDGFDDVVVGATTMTVNLSSQGRVYVYFGGPGVNGGADWILTGVEQSGGFGSSVSGGVDYNRDGFADVLVGSEFSNFPALQAGRAFLFYGGATPDLVPDLTVSGEALDDRLGTSVASAGDVTGDGFSDLIIGAPRYDAVGNEQGRAYIYDFSRYLLTAPNGGETWPVGSEQVVSWEGEDDADLWLSWDGGFTYELLRTQVGGNALNAATILVPHVPTRFARIRVSPTDTNLPGQDESDSLFTIETDIALLSLSVSPLPTGGAELNWATDPAVGPEGIKGYRLYRSAPGSPKSDMGSAIGPALITVNRYEDPEGIAGSRYRLTGVNGLGQELELGRAALAPAAALEAWPQPYGGGGVLNVRFAAAAALEGARGRTELAIFDAAGRRVRTLERGELAAGYHSTTWNGLDARGRAVPSGIYFLQLQTEGQRRHIKIVVAR